MCQKLVINNKPIQSVFNSSSSSSKDDGMIVTRSGRPKRVRQPKSQHPQAIKIKPSVQYKEDILAVGTKHTRDVFNLIQAVFDQFKESKAIK